MDLNAPLGIAPPPMQKRRARLFGALAIGAVVIAAGVVIAASDPHGGEPKAVAVVPPENLPGVQRNGDVALAGLSPKADGAGSESGRDGIVDRTPTGSLHGASGREDETPSLEHGVKVFRSLKPGISATPTQTGPLVIDVSRALDDPTRKSSMAAVQSPIASPAAPAADGPRIAIFVSGMGLDESATRTAIEVMPSAVSLAFLPYGNAVASLVEAAKARGHEVLLQLPMQEHKGGHVGPGQGPHSLDVGRDGGAMEEDLDWLLGRVQGYDGVTNLLGAAVSSDQKAMTAILKAVGGRHLFYVDDGTSKRSVAVSVGATLGVPARQADVVLDATADPSLVRANLETLVAIARSKGSAIGMASGLPEHLATIARFASELRGQGISLVPVETLAGGTAVPQTVTSTR